MSDFQCSANLSSHPTNRRLYEIDLLRAFSIFLILIHHMDNYTNFDVFIFLKPYCGIFGISLFVFLSGFSLFLHNDSFVSAHDYVSFYKKRLLRVFPLYLLSLSTFYFVFQVSSDGLNQNLFWWFVHALGVQMLIAPYIEPIFTLWFIGMILLFYLIYPILISNSMTVTKIMFNSLIIYLFLLAVHVTFNIIEVRFFMYYFIFILGITSCKLRGIKWQPSHYLICTIIFLVSFVFHFLNGAYSISEGQNTLDNLADISSNLAVLMAILLIILSISFSILFFKLAERSSKNLSGNLLRLTLSIAFASYAVYLFHRPFLSTFAFVLKDTFPIVADAVIYLIGIPILFILAYGIQKHSSHILNFYF
ncbi:MAG: hypothetical protein CVV31_12635 [Methanomicrobiales archaeon HGW-Methanomicrobiales-2]|nr:MAG: hypothetical protein CVV34_00615 [Methanomicrobiales archaeon HGW-Methanomicrobiales-5]PKL61217.1 MAG: hypothetical protein CVV31_12635 [Methanomicrobiales archaeon HGW-Methanomicrobiales-2]